MFKRLNVDSKYKEELGKVLNVNVLNFDKFTINQKQDYIYNKLELPKEFLQLRKKNIMPEYKRALRYIRNRGLSTTDILKYNIGYVLEGKYRNRVIIPSYDSYGKLNFFITRSFDKDVKLKYLNPSVVLNDIIPFELYINFNLPLFLTEGVFDAMTLKNNAIPLLGKGITTKLRLNLLQHQPPEIIIALDGDALETNIVYIKEFINNGIPVKFLDMPKDKDVNEMGYTKIMQLYEQSNYLSELDLLTLKMRSV